jgi:sugar phosphate isomerase/epimerase
MTRRITRRTMLAGMAAGLGFSAAWRELLAAEQRPFKIGACDWSLRQAQQLSALTLAQQLGLDGVEVSFDGPPKPDLRAEAVRQQYLAAAKATGVEICSLAMGVLNRVPYATDPQAEQWVEQSIDVLVKLGVRVVLVPFFMRGEIKDDPRLQAAVAARLKRVAPRAEKAGVVLALENALSADDNRRLLDAVGSPAVKVYYDVSNSLRRGYDIYAEIPQLGARIARVHLKEKGCLLGQGPVDFRRVRAALEKIGYRDWLVIEEALVKGQPVADCYRQNVSFVRSVFCET